MKRIAVLILLACLIVMPAMAEWSAEQELDEFADPMGPAYLILEGEGIRHRDYDSYNGMELRMKVIVERNPTFPSKWEIKNLYFYITDNWEGTWTVPWGAKVQVKTDKGTLSYSTEEPYELLSWLEEPGNAKIIIETRGSKYLFKVDTKDRKSVV